MNGKCILAGWGLAAACAGAAAGEPVAPAPAPATASPAEDAPAEQWQYHEKWDKALQRGQLPASKGAAPATECRPSAGSERGTVRPAPLPGRCPDGGVRVRT